MAALVELPLKPALCWYLVAALPGQPPRNLAVLLLDPATGALYKRFRRDLDPMDEYEAEFFDALEADLENKCREQGALHAIEWYEQNASSFLIISPREEMRVASFEARLNRLFREHVAPKVLPFKTHLPLMSLRAAAGQLGEEMEVEPEDWVEVPPGPPLTEDLFVAHVTGHSMEPLIPDGSLCVFRYHPAGSRQNRILLIERFGLPEHGGRYTVKRYTSKKSVTEEGWRHERIRLEPLNKDYEAWDLEPDQFQVIAEFVRVLDLQEE